jgi:zinc protease
MKKFIWIMIFLMGLISACGDRSIMSSNPESDVFPYPIHQEKLDNQLSVVTVEYPSPGVAAFYIIVRAGSREEVEPGRTGFAHFFEHMMFRGTNKYPTDVYNDVLMSIGAAANANTWMDRTVYHMTGNAEMLEKMFELEADRFMNLKYSVHDFKTEAGAVKGEYTKNFANPYTKLNEQLVNTAFDKHTYKHTTMGFWEDIVEMPNMYDYSLVFFERFYKPEYTTILVVGDVKAENVNQLAKEYFGHWGTGNYVPEIPVEPEQKETRFTHVQVPNFPPYLGLNFKSPAFDAHAIDNAAIDIINKMLFSQRSDLYKKLVLDEGKLRSISGYSIYTRDPHLISISASFKNEEDMQSVKDQIMEELEKLKTTPVDKQLLLETKQNIKNSLIMDLDNPSAIAETLSYFIWVTGEPNSFLDFMRMYDRVTQEDIMNVAQTYFTPERLTIATISSKEEGGIK